MDYKNKSKAELQKLIAEKKEGLLKFRFGIAGSKIKNMREGRVLRRDIARLETELPLADK
ncbi:MAG: 50S ribosomal protein L29 [Minisyncoccia bacterium]